VSALLFFCAGVFAGFIAPWVRDEWRWRRVRRQVVRREIVERELRHQVQIQHRRP